MFLLLVEQNALLGKEVREAVSDHGACRVLARELLLDFHGSPNGFLRLLELPLRVEHHAEIEEWTGFIPVSRPIGKILGDVLAKRDRLAQGFLPFLEFAEFNEVEPKSILSVRLTRQVLGFSLVIAGKLLDNR